MCARSDDEMRRRTGEGRLIGPSLARKLAGLVLRTWTRGFQRSFLVDGTGRTGRRWIGRYRVAAIFDTPRTGSLPITDKRSKLRRPQPSKNLAVVQACRIRGDVLFKQILSN